MSSSRRKFKISRSNGCHRRPTTEAQASQKLSTNRAQPRELSHGQIHVSTIWMEKGLDYKRTARNTHRRRDSRRFPWDCWAGATGGLNVADALRRRELQIELSGRVYSKGTHSSVSRPKNLFFKTYSQHGIKFSERIMNFYWDLNIECDRMLLASPRNTGLEGWEVTLMWVA